MSETGAKGEPEPGAASKLPWPGYDPTKPNGGRPPRATREEVETRIETIRQMIVNGHTFGDIKRSLSKAWGISRQSIHVYISKARKRNKQSLRITGDEAAATSIAFWVRRQNEAAADAISLRERMAKNEAEMTAWKEQMRYADDDHIEAYSMEMTRLQREADSLAKQLAGALHREAKAHDRIDTILGTRAPAKLAITDAQGKDIPRDPHVIEHRLMAMGFDVPTLPATIDVSAERLPTMLNPTRLEAGPG